MFGIKLVLALILAAFAGPGVTIMALVFYGILRLINYLKS